MDEFTRICYNINANLTPDEIKTVFSCFDPSRTGKFYYEDFREGWQAGIDLSLELGLYRQIAAFDRG